MKNYQFEQQDVFISLWLGFLLVKAPTWALGWLAIPPMWRYRNTQYDQLPWWTRPWGNPEDWLGGPEAHSNCLPKWWVDKHGDGFWSFYRYHAGRNGANGLRSFEWLDLDIDPKKVEYTTNILMRHYEPWHMRNLNAGARQSEEGATFQMVLAWYWCWQGWKAGYKYVRLWKDLQPHWWTDWKWWIFSGPKSGPRHMVVKFGWRVQPSDTTVGPDPDGIRGKDAGFATKAQVYRKG